ncbi:MAG: hypothetical protein WC775_04925 [Patescibacteria group bacterium]
MINTRKYFVVDVALLALGACVTLGWLYWKRNLPPPTLPKDTLPPFVKKLPNTVSSISGKIAKIENNSIDVVVSIPRVSPTSITTTPVLEASFKIMVSKSTQILLQIPPIPYLYKEPVNTKKSVNLKDLHVGQYVSIQTTGDVRSLKSDKVDAISIQVTISNAIEGTVLEVTNGSVIKLSALPPAPLYTFNTMNQQQAKVEYLLTITKDTEISYYGEKDGMVKNKMRLTPSQLKTGMQIKVYTDADLQFAKTGNTLRIEPMNVMPTGGTTDNPTFILPTLGAQ